MKQYLLISITFFLLFFTTFLVVYQHWGGFSGWIIDSDYYFHWSKANGNCPERFYRQESCNNYPPLYAFLSSFFSQNEWQFNLFPMFIAIFIIPLILYKKTKSAWSLLIYYSSSIVFQTFFASIFAQLLLLLIFALVLYRDEFDPIIDTSFLFIGGFTHSHALFVLLPVLFFKIFRKKVDQIKLDHLFLLFSFPNFPKPNDYITPTYFFAFSPLVDWFYSFKLSSSKLSLIFCFLLGGLFIDYRSLLFIPILWGIWLHQVIGRMDFKQKTVLLAIYLLWGIIQFLYFFYLTTPKVPIGSLV